MASMYFVPFRPAFDSAGISIPGSQHYFTVSDGGTGGEVPSAPYLDAALTIRASNPVVADGAGKIPAVYLDDAVQYRVRIYGRTAIVGVDTPLEEYAPYLPGTAGIEADVGLRTDLALPTGASFLGSVSRGTVARTLADRLDRTPITPEEFGAVRYDPANEVDSSVALQAFFDAFADDAFARKYVGDWRGEWKITQTMYAAYWNGTEPNVDRMFRPGTLRIPDPSLLPGGVPLTYALDVAGMRQTWIGTCGIHPTGTVETPSAQLSYYNRPCINGVRMRFVTGSTFGDFNIDACRRNALYFSSVDGAFTMHGINFPNAQNENARFGRINGRFIGSSDKWSEATPLVASAKLQGFASGALYSNAEVFSTGLGGSNSSSQRTRLTVPSTADLQIYDLVKCRLELTAAIYGTIAADNATSSFIWSAGDPTNIDGAGHGLQVGDVYPNFINGPNANKTFRITGFSGTSNRTIAVVNMADGSAPATVAADASTAYNHNGAYSFHWVTSIPDATHVNVFPWVPDRLNGAFHLVHGYVLNGDGGDLANSSFEAVISNSVAGVVKLKGLYQPRIGTVLGQGATIGVNLSDPPTQVTFGTVIEHAHIGNVDGCDVPLVIGSGNVIASINAMSAFSISPCVGFGVRNDTNDQSFTTVSFGQITLNVAGYDIPWQSATWGAALPTAIDNSVAAREQIARGNSATITVNYDRDTYRLYPWHGWAKIDWVGSAGAAPTGTLTLNMHPALAALGWTFAGAITGTSGSLSAGTASQSVKLIYIPESKVISVVRSTQGPPSVQAVTSAATVTPVFGNDLVKITAQATGLTLANPTGTAVPGWGIVVRILDNGTAQTIAFGTQYRAVGTTLPTTTVAGKTLYIGLIYNADVTKWDVVSVQQEA